MKLTIVSILTVIALYFALGSPGIAKAAYQPSAADIPCQCRLTSEFITGRGIPWFFISNDPLIHTGLPKKGYLIMESFRDNAHVSVAVTEPVDNKIIVIEGGLCYFQLREINLLDTTYQGYMIPSELPEREWEL